MSEGHHRFPRQDSVVFGRPAADAVRDLAERYGVKRLALVTSRSVEAQANALRDALGDMCAGVHAGVRAHSPREDVIAIAEAARAVKADMLVAFGGGSVIDAVKLAQFCLWSGIRTTSALGPFRMGRGPDRRAAARIHAGVRMIAIPTTLSAAEFTAFAGVSDTDAGVKEAYTHPDLAPLAVVLDPAATLATPPRLWLSTGMKAVDHAVEQLCNPQRDPHSDALAEAGLKLLGEGLPASKHDPSFLHARAQCLQGAWLSISGAAAGRGMGASHAIGHTLGGSHGVPHGITSCVTLWAVLAWNAEADATRQRIVADLLGAPTASDGVRNLARALGLPTTLSEIGIGPDKFAAIAEHTLHDRGVRTNPRPITSAEDIIAILEIAR